MYCTFSHAVMCTSAQGQKPRINLLHIDQVHILETRSGLMEMLEPITWKPMPIITVIFVMYKHVYVVAMPTNMMACFVMQVTILSWKHEERVWIQA